MMQVPEQTYPKLPWIARSHRFLSTLSCQQNLEGGKKTVKKLEKFSIAHIECNLTIQLKKILALFPGYNFQENFTQDINLSRVQWDYSFFFPIKYVQKCFQYHDQTLHW